MRLEDKILTLVSLTIMGLVLAFSMIMFAEQLPANQQRYNMATNYEELR